MIQEGLVVFRDLYASETNLSDLPQSPGPFHSLHLLRSGSGGERRATCRATRRATKSVPVQGGSACRSTYLHSADAVAVH
jgi:hypothetical protein